MSTTINNKDSRLIAEAYYTASKKASSGRGMPVTGYPTNAPGPRPGYDAIQNTIDAKLAAKPAQITADTLINGKNVDYKSIEIEGVDKSDYPDFADAFISYATFEDGTELNDEELSELTDKESGLVHDLAHKSVF